MKIGARAYTIDDIRFLGESGFDFAEIDWKDPDIIINQLPELSRLKSKYDLTYLAHGPNEPTPFDVDEIDNKLTPVLKSLMDLAPELDITLYTQHLWMDPRFINNSTLEQKQALLAAWTQSASDNNVIFCIENLSEHADHFAAVFRIIPELFMTLDLGHGELLTDKNTAFEFIDRYPHRIGHVHLHDNHGGNSATNDLHLPLGEGRIDFKAILTRLRLTGYDKGLSLELKQPHVEEGRKTIRSILRTP